MTTAGPFDLGDAIRLTAPATDAGGAPTNCTTMTLTVTLPDGTTATPVVTNPPAATGAYTVDYTPVGQAGRYKVRWVGTGPAFAFTDIFDVFPADPQFVLSLADARQALRRSSTVDDAELRLYMAAVTTIVEASVGPQSLTHKTWIDNGGKSAILLPDQIVAVISASENGMDLQADSDFTVNYAAGIIYRGNNVQPFPWLAGHNNIVIDYAAGTGIVVSNVRLASRIILEHLWNADHRDGRRPGVNDPETNLDDEAMVVGYAIPRRAAELLAPTPTIIPGFA